jgi:epoxyqueuosine reductase
MGLKERLKEVAFELGLGPVGITTASPMVEVKEYLSAQEAADNGTPFVSADVNRRTDPRQVWPETRSVFLAGLPYAVPSPREVAAQTGYLAAGSYGSDYHRVLGEKLQRLASIVQQEVPGSSYRIFVDTSSLMERPLAWRAGLGVWGQNTQLLPAGGGEAFFLGGLLLDIDLEPDEPQSGLCLGCGRCRASCPTGALSEPFRLEAKRCLSYLTQAKGAIPQELRVYFTGCLYGCDICLKACPLIKKAPGTGAEVDLKRLLCLSKQEFISLYGATAIGWRGHTVLQRNAVYTLGNQGDPAAVTALVELLQDPRPVIRGAAAWSLVRLGNTNGRAALAMRVSQETDPEVLAELESALSG